MSHERREPRCVSSATPVREINPLGSAEPIGVDFALTRGARVRLSAVGADGEPIRVQMWPS